MTDDLLRRRDERALEPPLFTRLVVEGLDGPVEMLPGWDDVLTGEEAARLVATHVAPADPERALDRLLEGVAVDVREQPWRASFDDYFAARAAITEVPRALAGLLLRPLADGAYAIVDLIPAPMRRPFDRALGILLDVVASLPGQAIGAHLPDLAGPLPEAVDLGLAPYPQIRNACGETMLATWLKGHGVPIATGELDTQVPFFPGGASLQDEELRKRGFTLVSGPGTFDDIRAYLAHGYPVMVNVEWETGGGHYAVVTGYDDRTREVLVDGYHADGKLARVPTDTFLADWERRGATMVVAYPLRDARLDRLREAGRLSRDAEVQEGLSLSDVFMTQRLEFFIEAAYRYRGTADDLTVRINLNTAEQDGGLAEMLGGSIRYAHRFDDDSEITVYLEKLSIKGTGDASSVAAFIRNLALYVSGRHRALSVRAGWERGAIQAELQAELATRLGTFGAEARVDVHMDGNYSIFLGINGRFA